MELKKGNIVFVPEIKEFAIILTEDGERSSVRIIGKPGSNVWILNENLILLLDKDYSQMDGTRLINIVANNLSAIMIEITVFLWRENQAMKNRIQQLEITVKNHHQDETLHTEIVSLGHGHDDIPA